MTAAAPLIAQQVLEAIADGLYEAFPITVPDIRVANLQRAAAGEDARPRQGYWELARNCTVIHAYGEDNWRPAGWDTSSYAAPIEGRHEHWIDVSQANISAIDNNSDEDD